MAAGLGADVTILDVDLERLRYLDLSIISANTLYSSEANLLEMMPECDLLIGAVLLPGAKAAEINHSPDAAKNEAGQCARGYFN